MNARADKAFYWRTSSGCQEWILSGGKTGWLSRKSPEPSLSFKFEAEGDSVRVYGQERVRTLGGDPLGAEVLESLCDDRWSLGQDDHVRFIVDDGAWYFSRNECEAADAEPAPSGCATRLAETIVGEQPELEPLSVAYRREGSVSVFREESGDIECTRWRFRRRGSSRYLVLPTKTDDGWFETFHQVDLSSDRVDISQPGWRDSSGRREGVGNSLRYPVRALSDDLFLIGGKPWFIGGRGCEELLRISTRDSGEK